MAKAKGELTPLQQRFVDLFEGNATEAALKAGYSPKSAHAIGNENLKKPEIAAAIRDRENKEFQPDIASRKERQRFWTGIMRDSKEDTRDRLKASEHLGRSEGDFLDRTDHTSSDGSMATSHSPAEVMAKLLRRKQETQGQ